MKKILFNGLLYSKFGAGISNYTKNLIDNMRFKSNIDFMLSDEVKDKYKHSGNIHYIKKIKGSKDRIIFEQLKGLKKYKEYDVIHFPDYATPILTRKKKVATIHDMAFFTMKECYTKGQIWTKKFLLNQTVKKADKLICISNFTYNELKRYYPDINEDRIEVIYNGFSKPKSGYKEVQLDKFAICNDYILFVGTISPSKNLVRLIQAFNKVCKVNKEIKLVIVGKNGWKYEDVYKTVSDLNMKDSVIFTGYVSNDELETLYHKSMFVVYPSLYEGFGLPPLEALYRKKPVLVSDIPVLKEILEESAFYCDPYNIDSIYINILDLINDKNYRISKLDLAEETVNKYSWEKCAKETYKVYEELVGE